jgi:hypothetical protein
MGGSGRPVYRSSKCLSHAEAESDRPSYLLSQRPVLIFVSRSRSGTMFRESGFDSVDKALRTR